MTMEPKDVGAAVFAALIWGATFPISALALAETPPIFFTFLRFLCAGAFAFAIPRPSVPWRKLVLLGVLLGAGQYGLMFLSMTQGIQAGLASLLVHTQAFFTIAIAMVVFSERPSRSAAIALTLALAGLAFLVAERAEVGALGGLALILLAALGGASGNIVLKSLGPVDMVGVAVWMSLVPPVPLLVLSFVFEGGGSVSGLLSSVSAVTVAAVVYSAVLATVLVFSIWGRLFVAYSAAQVAPFFLLVPVFGIALSALVLGETVSVLQAAGMALVFAGLVLAVWPASGRRSPPPG